MPSAPWRGKKDLISERFIPPLSSIPQGRGTKSGLCLNNSSFPVLHLRQSPLLRVISYPASAQEVSRQVPRWEVGHPSRLAQWFPLIAIHGKLFFSFSPSAFTNSPLWFQFEFFCKAQLIRNQVTPETAVYCMKMKTIPMLYCLRLWGF